MADFYESAARDLPNFPRPVIDLWFEHAVNAGWPPALDRDGHPFEVWANVLGDRRPFTFWHTVTWRLESLPLRPEMLEPETGSILDRLGIAHMHGLSRPPGSNVPDARARVGRFLDMLRATKRLPHPPVLLRVDLGLEVLDGNHRLAALFVAQANEVQVEPLHEVWVASEPTR